MHQPVFQGQAARCAARVHCQGHTFQWSEVEVGPHHFRANVEIVSDADGNSVLEMWSDTAVVKGLQLRHSNKGICLKV